MTDDKARQPEDGSNPVEREPETAFRSALTGAVYPHGVDADGHCSRCGIAEENPILHECPAGFAADDGACVGCGRTLPAPVSSEAQTARREKYLESADTLEPREAQQTAEGGDFEKALAVFGIAAAGLSEAEMALDENSADLRRFNATAEAAYQVVLRIRESDLREVARRAADISADAGILASSETIAEQVVRDFLKERTNG